MLGVLFLILVLVVVIIVLRYLLHKSSFKPVSTDCSDGKNGYVEAGFFPFLFNFLIVLENYCYLSINNYWLTFKFIPSVWRQNMRKK